jgi:hypothetical protein
MVTHPVIITTSGILTSEGNFGVMSPYGSPMVSVALVFKKRCFQKGETVAKYYAGIMTLAHILNEAQFRLIVQRNVLVGRCLAVLKTFVLEHVKPSDMTSVL